STNMVASPSFERSWFDVLDIQVSNKYHKDCVVLGRRKSAIYSLTVRHIFTQATITIHKTDFDFEKLCNVVKAALHHGHACEASCPWYYVDVNNHVPRRRIFHSTCSRPVVMEHMRIYQDLFNRSLSFMRCAGSRTCPFAGSEIPRVFFDFLFLDIDTSTILATYEDTTRASSVSSSSSVSSNSGPGHRRYTVHKRSSRHIVLEEEECGLCRRCIDSGGASTLPCGHVFHDECIIEALNDCLECPTCASTLERLSTLETPAPIQIS
ncbi:hypothetical protein AC1031_013467, partial [Aphanomyces cochlioides]